MKNLKQILAGVTLAGAAIGAGATGSTEPPPGSDTPPPCNGCTPTPPPPPPCNNCTPTPPPVQPPVIVTPPPVTNNNTPTATSTAGAVSNSNATAGAISNSNSTATGGAGGAVTLQSGAIAPVGQGGTGGQATGGSATTGTITNDNASSATIGAGVGAGTGTANVTVEGTKIPRFTGHIGLGGAQAYAPNLPGLLHRCKDATSSGWNLLGLFGTSNGATATDQKCLGREMNLEEKRLVCNVAVQALHHPNALVVQNAMNAMGEVCDKGFATALTATRTDFKACALKQQKVNVLGECEEAEKPKVEIREVIREVVKEVPAPVVAPVVAPAKKPVAKKAKPAFTGCNVTVSTPNACTPEQRKAAQGAALEALKPR